MSVIRRFLDFYLDASIHVAFAVMALIQITGLSLNISTDHHLNWFLFFGSIACYNFVKYGVEAEKYILVTDLHQRHIQGVSFIALAVAGYHGFFLSLPVYVGIAVLVVLTGLYAIPLLPHTKNLRSLGGLKIFVVALVWAGATVILPVIAAEKSFTWDVQVETVQRFLLVLILLVPFEIRDFAYDSPQLRTLPQRFGITGAKIIGACAIVPFYFMTLLKDEVSVTALLVNGMVCLLLGLLIWMSHEEQRTYFASFLVEGVPLFWWGLLLLSAQF